jgi:hypothetical protein
LILHCAGLFLQHCSGVTKTKNISKHGGIVPNAESNYGYLFQHLSGQYVTSLYLCFTSIASHRQQLSSTNNKHTVSQMARLAPNVTYTTKQQHQPSNCVCSPSTLQQVWLCFCLPGLHLPRVWKSFSTHSPQGVEKFFNTLATGCGKVFQHTKSFSTHSPQGVDKFFKTLTRLATPSEN